MNKKDDINIMVNLQSKSPKAFKSTQKDIDTLRQGFAQTNKTLTNMNEKLGQMAVNISSMAKRLGSLSKLGSGFAFIFSINKLTSINSELEEIGKEINLINIRMGMNAQQSAQMSQAMSGLSRVTGSNLQASADLAKTYAGILAHNPHFAKLAITMGGLANSTGLSHDQAAQYADTLTRIGGLGPETINQIAYGMMQLKHETGMTNEDFSGLMTSMNQLNMQLVSFSKSASVTKNTQKEVAKLSKMFRKAGIDAKKAAGLVENLFNPENAEDMLPMISEMGISTQEYMDILDGNKSIKDFPNKLKKIADKAKAMGNPIAAQRYVKTITNGQLSLQELYRITNTGASNTQANMDKTAKSFEKNQQKAGAAVTKRSAMAANMTRTEAAMEKLKNLTRRMLKLLKPVIDALFKLVNMFVKFGNKLINVFNLIEKKTGIFKAIGKAIVFIGEKVFGVFSKVLGWITKLINEGFGGGKGLLDTFKKSGPLLVAVIAGAIFLILKLFKGFKRKTKSNLKSTFTEAGTAGSKALIDVFKKENAGKRIGKQIGSEITKEVKTSVKNIKNQLNLTKTDMKSIGKTAKGRTTSTTSTTPKTPKESKNYKKTAINKNYAAVSNTYIQEEYLKKTNNAATRFEKSAIRSAQALNHRLIAGEEKLITVLAKNYNTITNANGKATKQKAIYTSKLQRQQIEQQNIYNLEKKTLKLYDKIGIKRKTQVKERQKAASTRTKQLQREEGLIKRVYSAFEGKSSKELQHFKSDSKGKRNPFKIDTKNMENVSKNYAKKMNKLHSKTMDNLIKYEKNYGKKSRKIWDTAFSSREKTINELALLRRARMKSTSKAEKKELDKSINAYKKALKTADRAKAKMLKNLEGGFFSRLGKRLKTFFSSIGRGIVTRFKTILQTLHPKNLGKQIRAGARGFMDVRERAKTYRKNEGLSRGEAKKRARSDYFYEKMGGTSNKDGTDRKSKANQELRAKAEAKASRRGTMLKGLAGGLLGGGVMMLGRAMMRSEKMQKAIKPILEAIGTFAGEIAELLEPIIKALVSILKSVFKGLMPLIELALKILTPIFKGIAWTFKKLGSLFSWGFNLFGSSIESLEETIKNNTKTIKENKKILEGMRNNYTKLQKQNEDIIKRESINEKLSRLNRNQFKRNTRIQAQIKKQNPHILEAYREGILTFKQLQQEIKADTEMRRAEYKLKVIEHAQKAQKALPETIAKLDKTRVQIDEAKREGKTDELKKLQIQEQVLKSQATMYKVELKRAAKLENIPVAVKKAVIDSVKNAKWQNLGKRIDILNNTDGFWNAAATAWSGRGAIPEFKDFLLKNVRQMSEKGKSAEEIVKIFAKKQGIQLNEKQLTAYTNIIKRLDENVEGNERTAAPTKFVKAENKNREKIAEENRKQREEDRKVKKEVDDKKIALAKEQKEKLQILIKTYQIRADIAMARNDDEKNALREKLADLKRKV